MSQLTKAEVFLLKGPIIGLTATLAKKRVSCLLRDIGISGTKKDVDVIYSFMDRPNVYLSVQRKHSQSNCIAAAVKKVPKGDAFLCYCPYRANVNTWYTSYNRNTKNTRKVGCFHSDVPKAAGLDGRDIVGMLCTVAFGMGVDKPNVRIITHNANPFIFEGWWHEVGRIGRDSDQAASLTLYAMVDINKLQALAAATSEDSHKASEQFSRVPGLAAILSDNTYCYRQAILDELGWEEVKAVAEENCCDVCAFFKHQDAKDMTVVCRDITSYINGSLAALSDVELSST